VDPELLAPRRQEADEVGQPPIVGVSPGLPVERGNGILRGRLPVGVEAARARVEEQEARRVDRPGGVPVELRVEGLLFRRNVGIRGGSAPVRAYLPELLDDVLAGRLNPGRVFDLETDLEHIADAYAAMDERHAIKGLVRVAPAA
jgi:hypothetical protein